MAFWIIRGGLHAERKATELQYVLKETQDWDVNPVMSRATMERLRLIGKYKLNEYFRGDLPLERYKEMIEAIDRIDKQTKSD
jgi:hypothetical protein